MHCLYCLSHKLQTFVLSVSLSVFRLSRITNSSIFSGKTCFFLLNSAFSHNLSFLWNFFWIGKTPKGSIISYMLCIINCPIHCKCYFPAVSFPRRNFGDKMDPIFTTHPKPNHFFFFFFKHLLLQSLWSQSPPFPTCIILISGLPAYLLDPVLTTLTLQLREPVKTCVLSLKSWKIQWLYFHAQ